MLRRCFTAAGLAIEENVRFVVDDAAGAVVHLDGWDASRRVGYEYITTEAGDPAEFTPAVIDALEARMRKGDLWVFLIDERDIATEAALASAAEAFLSLLRAKGALA